MRCYFCRARRWFGFGPTIYRDALWGNGMLRNACARCRNSVPRKERRRTQYRA